MPKISAYFISDLHLGARDDEEERVKQQRVLRFLKSLRTQATHLFIVGDLFDFWFEYKYVTPKECFEFLYELKRLTEQGVTIHYLAGNHDFALNSFFIQHLNIQTHLNELEIELGGKKFYLFHGDGVAGRDVGYRILKKIVRNKMNQRLFRLLHPDFGIPLARFVSGSSRKYTNQMNHLRDERDYIAFAARKFEAGFDYVLMGHRHNPLVHEVQGKKYINLGDWIENFTYAFFDGTDLKLIYLLDSKG
jgi:UDP-2,3-diacylglucosamine hydrolase